MKTTNREAQRRAISLSQEGWVEIESLRPEVPMPTVVRAALDGVALVEWVCSHQELLDGLLRTVGAVLFRGFDLRPEHEFERFAQAAAGELLEYRDHMTPRQRVGPKVYTSTEYPPDQCIELHNESSYSNIWPMRIIFCCITPAREGGETPIADARRVFENIEPSVRNRFMEKGVMYVRNFGDKFGLSWQEVFKTTDRTAVEEYCRKSDILCEWKRDGRLRTRQVRPAAVTHPRTGEMLWFNQATAFHVSTLEPKLARTLLSEYAEDELPKNVFYGDGSSIEAATLNAIREAHRKQEVSFRWQKGDVLLLDNMMIAHGRNAYQGARRILVSMGRPFVRLGA